MTKPRWLDDEEQLAWRAIVDGFTHLVREIERPVQEASGLNGDDYAMLVYLSEAADHSARMIELAECSGLPSGQVTYRVDRLVKLGFVERKRSETDRRGSIAALTPNGLEAFTAAAAVHVDAVRTNFLDNLTRPELLALADLMRQASRPAIANPTEP